MHVSYVLPLLAGGDQDTSMEDEVTSTTVKSSGTLGTAAYKN